MTKLKTGVLIASIIGTQAAADMQYSLPFNETNEFSKIAIEWANAVSAATNGEVTFEPVANSALVTIPETLDAIQGSVVPAAMGVASAMAGTIPAFGYLELNLSVNGGVKFGHCGGAKVGQFGASALERAALI